MSFNATLYNCKDDPRKLKKTLTNSTPINTIRPTENCDILNPVFILDYNGNYATKNYITVGAPFNRSYFITDMKVDIGKKIVINCAVDVLGTYQEDIKKLTVNVIRSESLSEPMLPDSEYKIKTSYNPYTKAFNNRLFNEGCYVLSWLGGDYDSEGYIPLGEVPQNWETNWGDYWIYDTGLEQYRQLHDVYPSAAIVPSFQTMVAVWRIVYTKVV